MTQKLNPFSTRQFLDANGDPYVAAKLFTYLAGTSTKKTVTKDLAGLSNHTNPVILNSRGEPSDTAGAAQAMWQPDGTAIDLVLAPAGDTDPPIAAISTWENISGINDEADSGSQEEWIVGTTPTFLSATKFTVVGDQITTYHVGRRIKSINSAGTIYSLITATVFTTLTTVTVVNDSGALDSGLSAVSVGLISSVNPSVPGDLQKIRDITLSGVAKFSKGADVASATALVVGSDGNYFDVTGTTTITSITTVAAGTVIKLHFDGALVLTHHATNLILPGAVNYTTVAGDEFEFTEYAAGTWRCTGATLASGNAIVALTASQGTSLVLLDTQTASSSTSLDFTTGVTSTYDEYLFKITDINPATDGATIAIRVGDSGSFRVDGNYNYHRTTLTTASALYAASVSTTDTGIQISSAIGNVASETYSGDLSISNPLSTTTRTPMHFEGTSINATGVMTSNFGSGAYAGTAFAVDRFRFLMSAGNMVSGTIRMYGFKKS